MTRQREYDENGRCITHKQSELLDICLECAKEDWEDSNLNIADLASENERLKMQLEEALQGLEKLAKLESHET